MTTTTTDSIADIVAFGRARGACSEALAWLRTQPDAATAWEACERPDWLIWWLKRQPATDRKTLVRIACACARTALRFVPEGEERPLFAIETTERWLGGGATIEEVRTAAHAAAHAAADAAYDAAYDAYDADADAAAYDADAAADAAYDAAYAAYDADAAAYDADAAAAHAAHAAYDADADAAYDAAAYAAYAAAHAAAHAAHAAAYDAAWRQANIQMCGIIRAHVGMGGAL